MNRIKNPGLFILAIIFTISLIFASLEFPRLADNHIQNNYSPLHFDQQSTELNTLKTNMWLENAHLKEIGYAGFFIIIAMIVIGFISKRRTIAAIGAIAMFLPVFGHFAITMFFLAGLGFLRVLWFPLADLSPWVMELGHIVYLPAIILSLPGKWFHFDMLTPLSVFFIAAGVILFIGGVFNWLVTKYTKNHVATSFLYKISRHPQYLGWILWSYGLFLMPVMQLKKGWGYPDSLPWMIATMIIVGIALAEEVQMRKRYGEEYLKFEEKTHFLFPVPKWFKKFLKHPYRLFFKTEKLKNHFQVMTVTAYYIVVLMILSYFYISFSNPQLFNPLLNKKWENQLIANGDLLINGESRRAKDIASMNLERHQQKALPALYNAIENGDPESRAFAIRTLWKIGDSIPNEIVIKTLQSPYGEEKREIINYLSSYQYEDAEELLLLNLKNEFGESKGLTALALANINSSQAGEYILQQFDDINKWEKMDFLLALGKLQYTPAFDKIVAQTQADDEQIRQAALVSLILMEDSRAVPVLEKMQHDDNKEIRVYAQYGLKKLS